MDEEAALEQAVKFCQVHLGAAAQRQVSVTQRVPASLHRAHPVPAPLALGQEVRMTHAGTIPVVRVAEGRRAGGSRASGP